MSLFLMILLVFSGFSEGFCLDLPVSKISDDSLLRNNLKNSWFTDIPARVLMRRPVIEYLPTGERVEARVLEGRDDFMVLLSRELVRGRIENDAAPAVPRRETGQFPGWAQGSWMLTRNKETGAGTIIRIFLRSDQYTYVQFRPFENDKCYMDVVLYGGFLARSLPVAIPFFFENLYTMPLNDIIRLAGEKFPLRYFEPDLTLYRDSRRFVTQVRRSLSGLRFADDGAIDENGNYVFIDNLLPQPASSAGLNCSGFTKWLIDGVLRPITGKRLPIAPLKAPFGDRGSSFTELWEDSRDPFFGLDWIRNLAAEANGTLRSASYRALDEFEVRTNKFALVMVNENRAFVTRSYPGFLSEAGYGTEGLHPLLYTLAIDEPYSFYLAAINTEIGAPITPENLRGGPRLRQYYHVAALVPYFDELGVFRVVVFESAAETSFAGFRSRYPGHQVSLARIPVPAAFEP